MEDMEKKEKKYLNEKDFNKKLEEQSDWVLNTFAKYSKKENKEEEQEELDER